MAMRWFGLWVVALWLCWGAVAHAAVFSMTPDPIAIGNVDVDRTRRATGTLSVDENISVQLLPRAGDCTDFRVFPSSIFFESPTRSEVIEVEFSARTLGAKTCLIDVRAIAGSVVLFTFSATATGFGPQVTLEPANAVLAFGNVDVGQRSTSQRIAVTNSGNAPLDITRASVLFGSDSFSGVIGIGGAQTVAPGAEAHWDIACTPVRPGSQSGAFRIETDDLRIFSINVDLTCSGDQGAIATIPSAISFGGVLEGTTSTRSFTLRNTGNVAVANFTAALSPTGLGYAFNAATLPATLNPGQETTLEVSFGPANADAGGSATLTINGTWHGRATATSLVLNGDGQKASVLVSPALLAFGEFRFDTTPLRDFTIRNNGDVNLDVIATTFMPDLGTASNELTFVLTKAGAPVTLPNTLTRGQQILVQIAAAPGGRTGLIGGRVDVRTSLGGTDTRVVITGNATAAQIMATPMVDFGTVDVDGAAVTRTVKITNTGTALLNVSAITKVAGADADSINRFTTPGVPSAARNLAPGAEISLDVTYKPTVVKAAGQVDSLVLVATLTGAVGGPVQSMIVVQGRGVDNMFVMGDAPEFPPTFKNPGDQAPVRTLTVRNGGEAVLKVTSLMLTGDPVWTLLNPEPVDIPGNGSHDFMIRFAPTVIGPAPAGTLTIVNNDNQRTMAMVTLNGDGIGRSVAFGPPTIHVGTTGVGAQLTVRDILAVTNMDSRAAFKIRAIELSDASSFHVEDAPENLVLPAAMAKPFAITFAPDAEGHFETMATLFLDQDPEHQAQVRITGDAVLFSVHGGGGCATGRSLGAGTLLGLLGVLLAVRRRRGTALSLMIVVMLGGRTRADDIRVGAFEPTPATVRSGIQLESPEVGQDGAWAATLIASHATNPLAVSVIMDGQAAEAQHPIAQREMLAVGGAYAFLGRFEAGIRMPFYSQRGDVPADPALRLPEASGAALGDLTLHAKARLVQTGALTAGAGLHLSLPTATKGQFTGSDLPTLRLVGLATFAPHARVTLTANAGALLRSSAAYRDTVLIEQGSGLVWGVGASARLHDRLDAIAEVFGEWSPSDPAMPGSRSPVEGLAGLAFQANPWLTVAAAAGGGVTSGLGAPDVRATLSVAISSGSTPRASLGGARAEGASVGVSHREPDVDRDGVPDARDKCGQVAEDLDGFEDEDGCPDLDDDGDGIPDEQDQCAMQAETRNGIDDEDGCPEAPAAPAAGQSPRQAAEAAFARGRELMKQKSYADACVAFQDSQRLDPAAGTQYNLASCYVEIGKLATASVLFGELARSDKNANRRAKAGELASQLAARIPRLKLVVRGAPAGLRLFVDGKQVSDRVGVELPVDLGSHALIAGAPGFAGWRKTVEVKREGAVTTVEIKLEAVK